MHTSRHSTDTLQETPTMTGWAREERGEPRLNNVTLGGLLNMSAPGVRIDVHTNSWNGQVGRCSSLSSNQWLLTVRYLLIISIPNTDFFSTSYIITYRVLRNVLLGGTEHLPPRLYHDFVCATVRLSSAVWWTLSNWWRLCSDCTS